jgi:hypothetical protein
VLHHIQRLNGNKVLDDDFSLLQINLNWIRRNLFNQKIF